MSEAQLPEEILSAILRLRLSPSLDAFFAFPPYTANLQPWRDPPHTPPSRRKGAPRRPRPRSLLLVCKRWHRVGAPLLWASLFLGLKLRRVRAIAATLARDAPLGRAVRHLRVEGRFGPDLLAVLRCAPRVRALSLWLHVPGADTLEGLREGLLLIDPAVLHIHGDWLRNKAYDAARAAIEDAIGIRWKNLVRLVVARVVEPI